MDRKPTKDSILFEIQELKRDLDSISPKLKKYTQIVERIRELRKKYNLIRYTD